MRAAAVTAVFLSLVLCGVAPSGAAQTPPADVAAAPAPAEPAPVDPAAKPVAAPGERLANALLNAGAMRKLMDAAMSTLPAMMDEKLMSDSGLRRLSPQTQAKVRAYLNDDLPGQMRGMLDDASRDAIRVAGPRLQERYKGDDLGALASFFEGPAGAAILQKIFVKVGESLETGSSARPSTADLLQSLSGDEIKALAIFMSSPSGELFQRDGSGMFRIITNAFTEALDARKDDMEAMMLTSLCARLSPQEVQRMGGDRRCPVVSPT